MELFVSWLFWWLREISVQFNRSVVSDFLRPHELQHARPPCPSPTPRVHPNSCPSSWWCHPAILSSVVPFSSCPQSASIRVFSNESTLHMRWPKYWSFSFSISPTKEQPGLISFKMDWLDLLKLILYTHTHIYYIYFPDSSAGKESTCKAGDPGSISGLGRSARKGIDYPLQYSWASLVVQLVKNLPAIQETWVWSLGWEDPLEKGKATHSSILAWRIPWTV